MARHKKRGIEYFSLDCNFFSNRKIKILKSRYGADGITIFIYLLCEIYKNGYYIIVGDDFYYIVSDDLNMNSDKVKQVLTFLLERSMFDKQLFQSDAVLTSAGYEPINFGHLQTINFRYYPNYSNYQAIQGKVPHPNDY